MKNHYQSETYENAYQEGGRKPRELFASLAFAGLMLVIGWGLSGEAQAQIVRAFEVQGIEMEEQLVCSCCGSQHAESLEKNESPIVSARFDPFVIRHGMEDTRLLIEVDDPDIVEIRWEHWIFQRHGEPFDEVVLLDNGTQGDANAGDRIFTIDGISFRPLSYLFEHDPVPNYSFELSLALVYSDGSETEVVQGRLPLFLIDPSIVPQPSIYRGELHEMVDHTEYVIAIIDSTTSRLEIAQRYYEFMDDDRDFLFVAHQPDGTIPGAGYFSHVRSTEQGIGVSEIDWTASFGSAGRLTGIVSLTASAPMGLLNHEILHQWANFLDQSLNLGRFHWDVIDRPSTGFGASGHGVYSNLEHIGENRYRGIRFDFREPETKKFNDLELYLMGLIDIEEVESPIKTLVNPTSSMPLEYIHEDEASYGVFEAEGIRELSTDEIVAIHGQRSPGPGEARSSFAGAMVVVHPRPLTDSEFAYYDLMMREFEKDESELFPINVTFEQATEGLADMTTRLFPPLTPNAVTLVSPPPNHQHAEILASFTWERLAGVDSYHFQLATDTLFSDVVYEAHELTSPEKQIDIPLEENEYFWRVRATNEGGTGEWSEVWPLQNLTVSTATHAEAGLRVYPNPTTNQINVEYQGREPLRQVLVFDLLGQEHVRKEGLSDGTARIDVGHLDAGIYLLHVITSATTHVEKIQVAR